MHRLPGIEPASSQHRARLATSFTFWWTSCPKERLAPVLRLIRGEDAEGRRGRAAATLVLVQERMHGVTGADEKLARLRDGDRG